MVSRRYRRHALEWIDYRWKRPGFTTEQVPYCRSSSTVYGGINRRAAESHRVEVNSIVATVDTRQSRATPATTTCRRSTTEPVPRDGYLCIIARPLSCGAIFARSHVRPSARGGDVWTNVVGSPCRSCKQPRLRTPKQSKMQLIAVPYATTRSNFLKGRRVLADQMEYCRAFPRSSPLHARIQRWRS